MTRVVLMPSSFWPHVGGVEEATRHLAQHLQAGGDEVEVWAPANDRLSLPAAEHWQGLAIKRFPMPLPPARPFSVAADVPAAARGLGQLIKEVRRYRPELLHVHCYGPNGAYALVLSVITGTPLVLTLHGETAMDDQDIFERSVALRTGLRLTLRHARAVSACSAFTLAHAARFGLRPGRGTVIYNGVLADETSGEGAATAVLARSGRPYALALGRVVVKKGFDLLLRAAAEPAFPPDLDLLLAGEGPALDDLRELATRLGLAGRVRFAGRLGRNAVREAMRGAEIFVLPSRLEPFGIVLLEAWREGVPVIATIHGGPPEFVKDGIDGALVDPHQTGKLAETVRALHEDSAARERLGANGRRRVAEFSWAAATSKYRQLYADALATMDERAR